ncbi:MAG: Rossmann-like domain-containing protein [Beutenbergiaceae bacterium]
MKSPGGHAIYRAIRADLPATATVQSATIAPTWTTVVTSAATGIAMTPPERYRPPSIRGAVAGINLRDLAEFVGSWNVHESALGVAAINSHWNQWQTLPADDRITWDTHERPFGTFGGLGRLVTGKKVAIIGHGPHVEKLRDRCDLTVLERRPRDDDLPDPACEYVLGDQDFVFITASALANKTLPRLIELSQAAFTAVWGPSTPLCPALFDLGVDALLGCVFDEPAEVTRIAGEGGYFHDFQQHMTKVNWFRDTATVRAIAANR